MEKKKLVLWAALFVFTAVCSGAGRDTLGFGWRRLSDLEMRQFVGKTNCCRGTEHHADCLGPNQEPFGCYGCAEFPHSGLPDDPCPNVIGDVYTQVTHTEARLDAGGWGVFQSEVDQVCYETRLCDPQSTMQFHRCPGEHGAECVEDPEGLYDCRICVHDDTILVTNYVYPSICAESCNGSIGSGGGGGGNNNPS